MKLGRSAMEELDLDSFLNSMVIDDNGSDVENDLHVSLHRTVDDILNDYEISSSSSSPPSLPPLNNSHLWHSNIYSDCLVSEANSDSFPTLSECESETSSDSLVGETLKSKNEGGKTNSVLPPLFRSFRPNVNKPGDALAAAAAASRSIPTPHAAAIKSSRACLGTMSRALCRLDLSPVISDDSEYVFDDDSHGGGFMPRGSVSNANTCLTALANDNQISEEIKQKETFSSEENTNGETFDSVNIEGVDEDEKSGNFIGREDMICVTVPDGKDLVSEKQVPTVVHELEGNDLRVDGLKKKNPTLDVESMMDSSQKFTTYFTRSGDSSSTPGSLKDENKNVKPSSPVEHSFMVEGSSSTFESGNFVNRGARKCEEELETTAAGIEESDKVMLLFNDGETSLPCDENFPGTNVSGLVEDSLVHMEKNMDIRRIGKKLDAALKPLELAEELEKKSATTGLHWEEGAAAQPMRLEGVQRGSTVSGYFNINSDNNVTRIISSQAFRRDHGSLRCVAVHPIFVSVGMSKGLIIVVSSRYSADNVDNMDEKVLMLGSQGDQSHSSITSICFNHQGDLLLAGYADGHATVWDVQRGAVAKVITGEHTAPVVHAFFLGQDSRQFVAVTGDSKGLVLFHEFSSSKVPMINRFSLTTKCIIDGQRGKVLCASPLLLDEFSGGGLMSSHSSMMDCISGNDAGWKFFNGSSSLVEEGVAIFVTYQAALVIRITPTPKLYAQLSRPDGVREGSMPYVAWKCAVQSNNSSYALGKVSLLSIAWDRKVLVTMMVNSEMKICGKWILESAAIGVVWLDEQMLVILTSTGQLCLYAKDGSFIHKTSFSIDGSVTDDLIMYHTQFTNMFGNPEKSFHNSVAARGGSIYIIGPSHLIVSRLLPWKERIVILRKAGDWMGALNMAITIYDGEAHDIIDLPRSVDAFHEAIMPYLVELLLSYVDEVFSYISVAFYNQLEHIEQINDSKSGGRTVHFEMNDQYTRVGGVAVEFCEHIKKTDILFDEIYSKFVAVQQRDTFLELLEPYILKDMLHFLPPEIMQALVEHYSSKGWLQRVEQCVLHMDISSLDFNQVVKICREHGLYGALIYLFNRGLDDFRAPLEELLTVLQNSHRESAAPLGYKMLVYLKYCFTGLAFPPGHGTLPPERLPSLRNDLVQFLLEESNSQSTQSSSYLLSTVGSKNLYHLLELDTEATLYVLSFAFDEDKGTEAFHNSTETIDDDVKSDLINESNNFLIQKTIDALAYILDKAIPPKEMPSDCYEIASIDTWPSKKDLGHVYDFIAYYIACQRANVSKSLLGKVFEYLTTVADFSLPSVSHEDIETSKVREKRMLSLLEVLPRAVWDESYVLHLSEKAQFYQVSGLIYTFRQHYLAALDSYMKDINEPIHTFSFIHNTLLQLADSKLATFRSAIISRIPELVKLSREDTLFMVISHFNNENPLILMELRSHPKSLFLYLKTVIEVYFSGTLDFPFLRNNNGTDIPDGIRMKDRSNRIGAYLETVNDFSKILRNNPISVNDDIIELYLQLLCQYEQKSVLKFLQTFESYRVEHCLRLCQEYKIIDAAVFLLERVGDVGSALLLSLSDLNDKFLILDAALKNMPFDITLKGLPGKDPFCSILRIKEVSEIHAILRSCIGLCQRNSPRLDLDESKFLWFQLLDTFCIPFIDSDDKMLSDRENCDSMPSHLNLNSGVDKNGDIKWKISKSGRWSVILKKLFSMFIKEIVEGMMGHVHLPEVMSKLLSDNSSQEFGDFKPTIMEMLDTYVFEKRILHTAKSLIEDDAFHTTRLLKKGASHGYAPQIPICCICNSVLASTIRVFSCGHSTHLQCELQVGGGSNAGCPVCMPLKKTPLKSRGERENNGLVNKCASSSQKPQSTHVLMPFESNGQDLRLISRFEILSDLVRKEQQRSIRIENVPHLRLAPPAIYHEKVKKASDFVSGADGGGSETRSPKMKEVMETKANKGSSSIIRFSPLKRSFFGKDKR